MVDLADDLARRPAALAAAVFGTYCPRPARFLRRVARLCPGLSAAHAAAGR